MNRAPERARLDDGYSFCRLINGCWQLAAGHSAAPIDRERALSGLERLARAGFDTFDCADIYTGVEELLGELRRRLRPDGIDITIHTKLVPDRAALGSLSRRAVERGVERSLGRLGVERLDLVQFHWWDWSVPGFMEAFRWLDELRRQGSIARLGVTNTDAAHLAQILDSGVEIATNQVQYSLLDRRPEHGLIDLCRSRGVQLLCYGTLAGGFLAESYLDAPPPSPPLGNRSLEKYRLIIEEIGGWPNFQRLLQRLAAIAERHGTTIATVASRWALDRPQVAGVIVGATGDRHLEDALGLFELALDERDRADLAAFLDRHPGPPGAVYSLERRWEGPHGRLLRTDLNRDG